MLSYQCWIKKSISNNFIYNNRAEVAQQVEFGSNDCGGKRTTSWGVRGRSGGVLLSKGWTELLEVDSPFFITQGQQLLNWKWDKGKRTVCQPLYTWLINIFYRIKKKNSHTWKCWKTKGFGIKSSRRTFKDLINWKTTQWAYIWIIWYLGTYEAMIWSSAYKDFLIKNNPVLKNIIQYVCTLGLSIIGVIVRSASV